MKKTISFVLSSLLLTSIAYAHSKDKTHTNFEAVTVTANKIEENIIDVPQSITVITDEQLENKGIKKYQK